MNRREAGFTLVEMLVALALLALASVLMLYGFSASRAAAGRLRTRRSDVEAVARAQARLRDALDGMIVRARFQAARPYVEMEGASDRLAFVAPATAGAPSRTMTLDLSGSGDLQLAPEAEDAPAEATLLRDVAGLELAYWGSPEPGAPDAWRSTWTHASVPPQLIRVRATFPAGDRRAWPELIVRPTAEVDSECVVDPDTSACRGRT